MLAPVCRGLALALLLMWLDCSAFASTGVAVAQEPDTAWNPTPQELAEHSLFENVAERLRREFMNETFRARDLPRFVQRLQARAAAATTPEAQFKVTQDLLRYVPATHLLLYSKETYDQMFADLQGRSLPTLGFEVLEIDGKHFVHHVWEGSPADVAGVKTGDRLIAIDGVLLDESPRLTARIDDAYNADAPLYRLHVQAGETLALELERGWGEYETVQVQAAEYSAQLAAAASARVIERDGIKLGHLHFWMIHFSGVPELLKEKLDGDFAGCNALVLDLRGRGGNVGAVQSIIDVVAGKSSTWHKPVVVLVDRETQSAKEVLLWELRAQGVARLVGEATAGAVIPANFADVGHGMILMFPKTRLEKYTELLEGHGLQPDVSVERGGPYSAGADPILDAGCAEAARLVKARQ